MIPKRIPAVVFRAINYSGPQRVKIDICKAVDQRFAFIDNYAFEAISPKITAALIIDRRILVFVVLKKL